MIPLGMSGLALGTGLEGFGGIATASFAGGLALASGGPSGGLAIRLLPLLPPKLLNAFCIKRPGIAEGAGSAAHPGTDSVASALFATGTAVDAGPGRFCGI